jgi:precorrin-2 dehydrogenase/sirohydrochlorin ferrochelatase
MSYFPALVKMDKKRILIVGGGNIAYEKLNHLLDFTSDIKVIASEFSDDIMQLIEERGLAFEKRAYKRGDIANYDIIIIAIDNIALQAEIYEESKSYKCLCNAVDSVDYCDFIFPSYIKRDDLIIAVSTSGASPAVAKHLRRFLQKLIPSTMGDFLREMRNLRKTLPKGKERMKMLDEKAKEYIERELQS